MAKDSTAFDDLDIDLLGDLDRSEAQLSVRVERRRYGKPMTIVEGFPPDVDLGKLASKLKRAAGAGGTVQDDRIEIQGDQVDRVVELLRADGYTV
ncbi:translation initiation factor [Haloarchaeobius sp. HME9146]|uniref:translation initiation factor n=1 Tax=Haloarchaeobius sp. HME9146 TaxID=2978732 RepID=UPI0021C05345|nr:translation initiation factor [Haloarchaeobius sp. HME9146]